MPGLIGNIARTAVVAGTATAVSGRVQRRQAERFAERDAAIAANRGAGYYQGAQAAQQQAYPPQQQAYPAAPPPPAPAAAPAVDDPIAKLQQLAELHAQGVLTDAEFAAAKAKVLA
ncbi:MAG: SHOCT domain-containing protein [Actinobacteria bacterium]|nr:SHOCT domain-containing protein [Actinomycetota bacterium]